MSKKTRNRVMSQEKVAILRLHLLERTPVSTHGIRVKTPLSVRRRSAVGRRVRQVLQPGSLAQRDRLHCSGGQAG